MSFYTKKSLGRKILYQDVDNPGKGDCGFYAFAIGIINVIQREIAKGNPNPTQLRILNSRLKNRQYSAEDFKTFNYQLKNKADSDLLERLKSDLREILFNEYLEEIHQNSIYIEGTNQIRKSVAYIQFSEIFYYYHHRRPFDPEMNLLFMSEKIRQFAYHLAESFKDINNLNALESHLQNVFMQDLYGEYYLDKTEIPWDATIANRQIAELTQQEIALVVSFKQFKMVAEDYYANFCSNRILAPGYTHAHKAWECANKMLQHKSSLQHNQVKLLIGNQPLNQARLRPGVLYLQLVNAERNIVRVYSKNLGKGYDYTTAKAQNLIDLIHRHCPEILFQPHFELTIDSSNGTLFEMISATANDTLNENIVFKIINNEFLEIYAQKQFNQSSTSTALSPEQQEQLTGIRQLLESEWTRPLELQEKSVFRDPKIRELDKETHTNSRIIAALSQLKPDRNWLATHQDLKYLAELFEVHLENLVNGKPRADAQGVNTYRRPVVTINNLGNYHWTTRIQIAFSIGTSSEKYAEWCYKDVPLSKDEIRDVLLSYTTGFVAFFGRTHRSKASQLIAQCNSADHDVSDIMQGLRRYMKSIEYNPNSSFLKRFEYLDARYRNIENTTFKKRDIERIFANYVHTGYFRNHLKAARQVIADCKNPRVSIEQVILNMNSYAHNPKISFNDNSHFQICCQQVLQLRQQAEVDEDKDKIIGFNL